MKIIVRILLLFVFLQCANTSEAQNLRWKDSVLKIINTTKSDTVKAWTLIVLTGYSIHFGEMEEATKYGNEAYVISEKAGYKKGMASALHNLGAVKLSVSDLSGALKNFVKALEIKKEIGNKQDIASSLSNLGTIFAQQGNYSKAMDYYFQALKFYEATGKPELSINTLNNIGLLFIGQDRGDKALVYFSRIVKICDSLNLKKELVYPITLCNMSDILIRQGNSKKAIEYCNKALDLQKRYKNNKGLGMVYSAFGNVYSSLNEFEKAIESYKTAQLYSDSAHDKLNSAIEQCGIGVSYFGLKKYKESERYLQKSLEISEAIGHIESAHVSYKYLFWNYEKLNETAKALEAYKKYIDLRDSVFSVKNTQKMMGLELDYELNKKENEYKVEHERNLLLASQEKKKQNYIILIVALGMVFTFVLAVVIFISLQRNKKKNKIIEAQKLEVEEKQKEVMDSIRYAKRIQNALMPSDKYLSRVMDRLKKD